MISIQIRGIDQLTAKFGKSIKPAIQSASLAIGEEIRNKLAVYPGMPKHPIKWTSAKQRRYYFAMRRKKRLPAQYTRNSDPMSQRLGPSWTVAKHGTMGAKAGTKVTYAKWVQKKDDQQPMHSATGWQTDEGATLAVANSGVVQRIVSQAIAGWLR